MANQETAQEIGRKIRMLRHASESEREDRECMTIEELAAKAGLTLTTVNKLELGYKSPRVDTLLALAQALEVTPQDLLPDLGKPVRGTRVALMARLESACLGLSNRELRELVVSLE